MSRQTDLSAFIAKKMNKNPEESQSLESKDTKKAGLQIQPTSLIQKFKISRLKNNDQFSNVTAPNQKTNGRYQFDSRTIVFSKAKELKVREQISVRQAQKILGLQDKLNAATHLEKQIQNQSDISEDTQVIQEEIKDLQVVHSTKLSNSTLKCPAFVLIGPFDTIFSDTIEDDLQILMQQCNKKTVIQFIKKQSGAKFTSKLDLLQKINDEQLWCQTMQIIVELLQKNKRCLMGSIRTLSYTGLNQSTVLTRLQVFLIASSMFLCLIPKQSFCQLTSFIQLMTLRANDAKHRQKSSMRLQKLKCVINYLKLIAKNQSIYQQKIIFERVAGYDYEYLADNRNKVLLDATVQRDKIETGYCRGVIVDFANKAVGGGFLTNGCAQEEILFSIFPELSIVKLICQQLRDEQAIIVKGARRYNLYSGYSSSFKFEGSYQHSQISFISTIVAVDAVDYSTKLSKASQYHKKFLRRQLHKMYVGIQGACATNGDEIRKVFTGKWGCGVFKGDEYLKFCIQWMVCSDLGLQMNFMHEDEGRVVELRAMVKQLKSILVNDLLGLIQQYGRWGRYSQKGLLNYLKEYS